MGDLLQVDVLRGPCILDRAHGEKVSDHPRFLEHLKNIEVTNEECKSKFEVDLRQQVKKSKAVAERNRAHRTWAVQKATDGYEECSTVDVSESMNANSKLCLEVQTART